MTPHDKQLRLSDYLPEFSASHHVFQHPAMPAHVSVPHPKKDLGVGLVHKLLKQAGLK